MRKIFYSFHYKRDAWRAGQVRNHNIIDNSDEYGVIDSVEWEKIEKQGPQAIKNWIQKQLKNTSVTVVLIGKETHERPWVEYEIKESWERGNALIGIYIHDVKNQNRETDLKGKNPFDKFTLIDRTKFSSICKTYDWNNDNGKKNMGIWAEQAFQERRGYKGETRLDNKKQANCPDQQTVINTPPAKPWNNND